MYSMLRAVGCTNAMRPAGKIKKTNGIVWAIQPPIWPLDQALLSNISCSACGTGSCTELAVFPLKPK